MIAHPAPWRDRARVLSDQPSSRSRAKRILPSIAKTHRSEHETDPFDPAREQGHEHTGSQSPSQQVSGGLTSMVNENSGRPPANSWTLDRRSAAGDRQ